MDYDDNPLSLPGTQDIDTQNFTQSQTQSQSQNSQPKVWGRLCPHKTNFPPLELVKNEYTLGRLEACDIKVENRLGNPKIEQAVSKIHFRIYRERYVGSNGFEDDIVYLQDESQNGTFVNSDAVGRGNRVILVNNDVIAIAKKTILIYVFMSMSGCDNSYLPDAVKRKYAVSRNLGAGACGEVKMCYAKNGFKKYAMKIISKSRITGLRGHVADDAQILNEVSICQNFKHPCIIRVIDYIDSDTMVYIILELMEGGELFERIKKNNGLPEKTAKFIFYQVVLAVNYLHDNGITHRDLKPENILLASNDEEPIVKVSDFGLSKIVDSQTMMKTFCGTPMYVAPEILQTGGRGSYTCQVDVWSLGVILYCSLSGLTPFRVHDKNHGLYDQIIKGMYNFNSSKFAHVSKPAKDLIQRMMTVDPMKRITIKKVLMHPWLRDQEVISKVNKLLDLPDKILSPRPFEHNLPTTTARFKRARLE